MKIIKMNAVQTRNSKAHIFLDQIQHKKRVLPDYVVELEKFCDEEKYTPGIAKKALLLARIVIWQIRRDEKQAPKHKRILLGMLLQSVTHEQIREMLKTALRRIDRPKRAP